MSVATSEPAAAREPLPASRQNVHIAFADALRATAILLVVTSHILRDMNFLAPIQPTVEQLGFWGVDVFFVLSGFLLGRPYVDALLGRRPMPKSSLYARRRFLRIWPAYAVVVLVGAALTHVHHGRRPVSLPDIVAHLTMTHNLFPAYVEGAANGALWTMATDAQFYVALPLLTWLLLRVMPERFEARVRTIVIALVGAFAIALVWRLVTIYAVPAQIGDTSLQQVFERSVVGMGVCFATGILTALAQALDFELDRAAIVPMFVGGLVLAVAVMTAPLWFPVRYARFAITSMDTIGAISAAGVIYSGLRLRSRRFTRFVDSRIVAIVAANAYALYLVHTIVQFMIFSALVPHVHVGSLKFSLVLLGLFIPTSAATAYVLHRFVERPFLTMKERARETAVA